MKIASSYRGFQLPGVDCRYHWFHYILLFGSVIYDKSNNSKYCKAYDSHYYSVLDYPENKNYSIQIKLEGYGRQ